MQLEKLNFVYNSVSKYNYQWRTEVLVQVYERERWWKEGGVKKEKARERERDRSGHLSSTHIYIGAVYICTEDAFPNKRLHQLAEFFAEKHRSLGYTARQLSDGIFVEHAATIVC